MLEEIHFWSEAKTKFWKRVTVMALILVFFLFAGYAWLLYQEKVQTSEANSNPQSNPAAAPLDAGADSSTNVPALPLSPLPGAANSNNIP